MFHVGQKVVCVVGGWVPPLGETIPQPGITYTIRSTHNHAKGLGYTLHEIVNQPRQYAGEYMECTFAHACFRPLIERKTDISALKALLVPRAKTLERVE